ncbi:MAG: tetratricopeptide repeat protein [Pirellulales bacterium]|nr:tetratricopeptide repeat protein [Pirellulales bacterium]
MSSTNNENDASEQSLPNSDSSAAISRSRGRIRRSVRRIVPRAHDPAGTSKAESGLPAEVASDLHARQLQEITETSTVRNKALRDIARSISANVTNPGYYFELAEQMQHQGQHDRAARLFQRALEVDPNHLPSCLGMAQHHIHAGETDKAEALLQHATEIEPENLDAVLMWASMLIAESRTETAEIRLRRVLEIDPENRVALLHLAEIERSRGHVHDAVALLDQALAQDQCDAASRWGRGMLALQQGEWSYGWQQYEWRWRTSEIAKRSPSECALWDGSPLQGKSLFVRGENLLIDNLMFASCLHDLALCQGQMNTRKCVLEIDQSLLDLFQRSLEHIECVPSGTVSQELTSSFDFWTPLASMPRHLRGNSARFPENMPPLVANESWREMHRSNLFDLGPGLKVGISWDGLRQQQDGSANARETIIPNWKPILDVEGVHLINLQGPGSDQQWQSALDLHPRAELVHWDFVQPAGDVDDIASLISALDLVITVPNRVAHVAGALDVPTWTVLADWPSWRWGLTGERTPWYPTMRLFRSQRPASWSECFKQMAKELTQMARKKTNWTR